MTRRNVQLSTWYIIELKLNLLQKRGELPAILFIIGQDNSERRSVYLDVNVIHLDTMGYFPGTQTEPGHPNISVALA